MGKRIKISSVSTAAMLVATALFVAYDVGYHICADAGSDQTVDTNVEVYFDGSGSKGENLNYTWLLGDGGLRYGVTTVHSFPFEGIYEIGLLVRDSSGHIDLDTVKITVHNEYPEANAGIDKRAYEDELVEFNASGTIDTPNDFPGLSFSWDFGDGSSATGMRVSHTYPIAGKYTVILMMTDNDGAVDRDIITVNVENLPPKADAGPDQIANEDEIIYFDGSASGDSPSDLPVLMYSWNFGDDSKGEGDKPTHTYTNAGTYTVTLTVTDDDGAVATDIMVVTVNNAPPIAQAGSDQTVNEDQIVFFSGVGQDTQSDQPLLSYHWDFGDGTVGLGKNPTNTYQAEGVYTVTLTVTDDDGDIGQDTMLVTVTNLAPVVDAGPDIEVNEDVSVQFRGYAYDTPSDEQFLLYSWNFGDSNSGAGENPTHIYTNQGTYTVALTVTDDNLVLGTDSLTVTVKNIPPTAVATYTSLYPIILAGDVLTFNAQAMDSPSDTSTLTYFWDFGDGATASGMTVTHAYSNEGIYEVTLTVTDDDGATAQDIIIVAVEWHTFEMEITPLVEEIMPGEKAEYVITLRNTGTVDDAFDLELMTSINPSWIDFVVKHISVQAKSIQKVTLEIMPPEDFPLDFDATLGFEVTATCVHKNTELSNVPLIESSTEDVTIIATYESRLRWAQVEVESLITDFSGGNFVDATLLKAVEEISEALFFASTIESLEFNYVMSFEHVKEGIHNLEVVNGNITTDYIVDLLLIAVNDEVRDTINIAEIQARADNIHVVDAWTIYANAQSRIAVGDYENGIEQYKNAYMEAERAEGEWVPREYTIALIQAINDIDNLLLGPYSLEALNELQQAKDELAIALNKSDHGLFQDSFVNVRNAVEHLQNANGFGAPTLPIIVNLTAAMENAVEILIIETETHVGVEVNDIKQAWSKFYKGQEFTGNGLYLQAIDKYDRAYTHALLAEDWIPIADAGPNQFSLEDETVYFNASNSRDRDGIVTFYEWDFGDGCKDYGVFVNHVYKDAGVYNVTLLVTDNEVLMDIDMMIVTVSNIAPTADIILDYVSRGGSSTSNIVYMDDIIIFDAIYTDTPSDLPDLVFQWNFGDDTTGFGAHIKHIYTWPGVYTVVLTVTDEDGDVGTAATTIIVNNVIPTASLTYSQIAYEDEVVYLSGYGFDSPSDKKTLAYTWDFGDGSTGAGKEATHIYTNEGMYNVTLFVTDIHGDVGISTITISVINPPPLADAGWIQFEDEDGVMSFSGTGLDTPSDQSLLTYYWDFGDGNGASGSTQSHTYTLAGAYTVTLTATDDNGDIGVERILVFVENVKPTANAGNDQTVNEDDVVSFSSSGSDTASDLPFLTYSWDFGDGSMGSGTNPTQVYTQAGTYLVTLTVMDDDGAESTDTTTVTVYNVVPTANAGSNQLVDEDELVFFTGSGTDTPTDKPLLTYEWDFGDGNAGFGKNPTHSYTDEDTYTVELTVTDDDGATHIDTMMVEVVNVAPMAMAGPDLVVYGELHILYFRGRGLDTPSDQSTLTYEWDFGDGTNATGIFVSHMYMTSGTYNLTLTVTDDDGETHTDIAVITVILDSDFDGLSDEQEREIGTDPFNPDTDYDGLLDGEEVNTYGSNPLDPDTDSDGLLDGEEVDYWNSRIGIGWNGNPDGDTKINLLDPDSDNDGLLDGVEVHGWNMTAKIDGSTILFAVAADPIDTDTDDDGIGDKEEHDTGADGYITNPLAEDTDLDGITDPDEVGGVTVGPYTYYTNPSNDDTDGDKLEDDVEMDGWDVNILDADGGSAVSATWHVHSSPTDADTDNDGLNDFDECAEGSDPRDSDTDNDWIPDDEDEYPTMVEVDPPDIVSIDITEQLKWGWWGPLYVIKDAVVDVTAVVKDNAQVHYVVITVIDTGDSATIYYDGDDIYFANDLDIKFFEDLLYEYTVRVTAYDVNGNMVTKEKSAGLISVITDWFVSTIEWIIDIFTDLYNFVAQAWNTAKNWILDRFASLISGCLFGGVATKAQVLMNQDVMEALTNFISLGTVAAAGTLLSKMASAGLQLFFGALKLALGWVLEFVNLGLVLVNAVVGVIESAVSLVTGGSSSGTRSSGKSISRFTRAGAGDPIDDPDMDGLTNDQETQLGSDPNSKDLFIEVDWTAGCKPLTDAGVDNLKNALCWALLGTIALGPIFSFLLPVAVYLLIFYLTVCSPLGDLERYFEKIGIDVHIELDEEITDPEFSDGWFSENDSWNCSAAYHQKKETHVYTIFGKVCGGNPSIGGWAQDFGSVICTINFLNWIFYAVFIGYKVVTVSFIHEIGHIIGMNPDEGDNGACPTWWCWMSYAPWPRTAFCSVCMSELNLTDKWSVDEP